MFTYNFHCSNLSQMIHAIVVQCMCAERCSQLFFFSVISIFRAKSIFIHTFLQRHYSIILWSSRHTPFAVFTSLLAPKVNWFAFLFYFGRRHGGASSWVHQFSLRGGEDPAVLAKEGLLPGMPQAVQEQAQVNPSLQLLIHQHILTKSFWRVIISQRS